MIMTDAFRAQRLVWRFKKSGGNGRHLKPTTDMDEDTRAQLTTLAGVREPEIAAIGLFRAHDDWVLITSARILWCEGGHMQEMQLAQVVGATIDARDLLRAGRKDKVDILTIETKRGERRRLKLENGPAFSGAWNALKMASAWRNAP